MVERASKSEQTLLNYDNLKINHLLDLECKKLSNQGVASVFN